MPYLGWWPEQDALAADHVAKYIVHDVVVRPELHSCRADAQGGAEQPFTKHLARPN